VATPAGTHAREADDLRVGHVMFPQMHCIPDIALDRGELRSDNAENDTRL
jgi:hypothetical protein